MTKTLKMSALALLGVLVLWACSGSGPQEIGEKFLNHMNDGEYAEAKKLASKDSQNAIGMLEGQEAKKAKLEFGEVKEDGDNATLSYKEDGVEKELKLTKEDGEWKAVFSKGGSAPAGANLDMNEVVKELEDVSKDLDATFGEAAN